MMGILQLTSLLKGKFLPGFPIKIDASAPAGSRFVGVEVNGKLIADSVFVVSEAAVVKPVFSVSGDDDYIKLTVPTGIDQQYFLSVSGEEKMYQLTGEMANL